MVTPYPKYKNSGIPWLGQIPEHWETDKISQLFAERREKCSDTEFQPLSVSKQGITPQLDTAVKTDNGDNRKKGGNSFVHIFIICYVVTTTLRSIIIGDAALLPTFGLHDIVK